MSTQHTPGPWHGERNITGADNTVVCTINRPSGGNVRILENANARLIAAAPELLEALEAFCEDHTRPCGCANCAIIAKAKGQP